MAVGFYVDMTRCIGCRACQVVCKDKNRLEVGTLYREAHTYTVGKYPEVDGYSYSFGCNHCEDAVCLNNCPVGAIYRADDGTVIQDQEKYIEEKGVSGKCDGCYGLRKDGNEPACVSGCPNRALHFGDMDELRKEYGPDLDNGSIAVLPSPGETHPNLLIKTKPAAFEKNPRKVNW